MGEPTSMSEWKRPDRVWVVAWPHSRCAHITEEARDRASEPMPNGAVPVVTEYVPSTALTAAMAERDALAALLGEARVILDADGAQDAMDLVRRIDAARKGA